MVKESMRWSRLLVLGLLVLVAGGLGWLGCDSISTSRVGSMASASASAAVARRSLRGTAAANESSTERSVMRYPSFV
ncbi:Pectate lyase [Musa troglodytarum]|uniref:Pectate lyase n=1 Tax=Musa troglodytarum TaxID=320322 RepID=A0A9E7EQW3_9LILI|nr:Pectate lyase [Musa troglodytarum]